MATDDLIEQYNAEDTKERFEFELSWEGKKANEKARQKSGIVYKVKREQQKARYARSRGRKTACKCPKRHYAKVRMRTTTKPKIEYASANETTDGRGYKLLRCRQQQQYGGGNNNAYMIRWGHLLMPTITQYI